MPTRIRSVVFCGAVDDGKSTLLGRLLVETASIPIDDVEAATVGGEIDYSLLTDGLISEREQGITIDVCYRHLRLPGGARRILADCPGHEQYTRNMAVAASTADTAVLLIDATRGVRDQSFRHASICALMGVTTLIVAINKLDAADDAEGRFRELQSLGEARIAELGFKDVVWVPTSGRRGDNVVEPSSQFSWYSGTTIEAAIAASTPRDASAHGLRLPVQSVIRADGERWYGGRIARGTLGIGDGVKVSSTGLVARVRDLRGSQPASSGGEGDSVAILLNAEIDLRRGDLLVPADEALSPSRAHLADLIWIDPTALDLETSYLLRSGPLEVPARVGRIVSRTDIATGLREAASGLGINDIGRVEVVTDRAILLDPYAESADTGGFVLVDRASARTVAAGLTVHALQRESDVVRHSFAVDRAQREALNGVRACVLWLTGLPGSGKSTVADALERRLYDLGIRSYVLDGDAIRSTLSSDLGFSSEDRRENVRRVSHVAQLMTDAGIVVIVSLVSPYRRDRELAKEIFAPSDFFEVFVDTPLDVCQERDPKGLYARAAEQSGTQMTGVGQVYEPPEQADVVLDGTQPVARSVEELLRLILPRRLR
jgi:bifunctional enzyme CysN/CysC